jgi:hypothetical protein
VTITGAVSEMFRAISSSKTTWHTPPVIRAVPLKVSCASGETDT